MNALRIASYILAAALAALGIWLTSQNETAHPDVSAAPRAVEIERVHAGALPEER